METAQRRWLIVNAVLVTAVVNLVLNWLPAWLAVRDVDHVPLWTAPLTGGTGVYTDTLGTLVILPFVTTVLCTTAVWRDRRAGRLGRARLAQWLIPLLALPPRPGTRGVAFALLTVVPLAVPFAALLALFAPHGLDHDAFIAYKTVLGVALGLVVPPVIAVRAMADPAGRRGARCRCPAPPGRGRRRRRPCRSPGSRTPRRAR